MREANMNAAKMYFRRTCINRIARSSTMALVACHAILACILSYMWHESKVMGYCILLPLPPPPPMSSTKHPFIRPFASILNINWHLCRHRFTNTHTHTQHISALDGNWNAHLMLNERTRPCGDVCRMWILHSARDASDSAASFVSVQWQEWMNEKKKMGEKRNYYYFEQGEVWDALAELRSIFHSAIVNFVHFVCSAPHIKHHQYHIWN